MLQFPRGAVLAFGWQGHHTRCRCTAVRFLIQRHRFSFTVGPAPPIFRTSRNLIVTRLQKCRRWARANPSILASESVRGEGADFTQILHISSSAVGSAGASCWMRAPKLVRFRGFCVLRLFLRTL